MVMIDAALKDILAPTATVCFLFGSAAHGRLTPESDVDLGAFFASRPDYRTRATLTGRISELVSRDVDLIVLNDCDLIIAMQAIFTGRLVFERTRGQANVLKAEILSRYVDFKFSRRVVEDAIMKGFPHA